MIHNISNKTQHTEALFFLIFHRNSRRRKERQDVARKPTAQDAVLRPRVEGQGDKLTRERHYFIKNYLSGEGKGV